MKKVFPEKRKNPRPPWDERIPWCHPNCRADAAAFRAIKGTPLYRSESGYSVAAAGFHPPGSLRAVCDKDSFRHHGIYLLFGVYYSIPAGELQGGNGNFFGNQVSWEKPFLKKRSFPHPFPKNFILDKKTGVGELRFFNGWIETYLFLEIA